jgi:hypothetical protein
MQEYAQTKLDLILITNKFGLSEYGVDRTRHRYTNFYLISQ